MFFFYSHNIFSILTSYPALYPIICCFLEMIRQLFNQVTLHLDHTQVETVCQFSKYSENRSTKIRVSPLAVTPRAHLLPNVTPNCDIKIW